MNLQALRLFLPKLRPVAFVPDAPSATLANHMAIGTMLRPPMRKDYLAAADAERIRECESDFLDLLKQTAWDCDLALLDARPAPAFQGFPPHQADPATALAAAFAHLTVRGELLVLLPLAEEAKHFGNLLLPFFRRDRQRSLDSHVWLRLVDGETVALFLAKSHAGTEPQRLDLAHLTPEALENHAKRRPVWREGAAVFDACDLRRTSSPAFEDCLLEWRRRNGARGLLHTDNLWMENGVLRVGFDGYQRRLVPPLPLEALARCNRLAIAALGASEAAALSSALADPRVRVSAEARAACGAAREAEQRARAPFYVLEPVQRLGWLREHKTITCAKDFGPFKKGQTYPLRCVTGIFKRAHSRPNLLGEEEAVTLHARDTIFEIATITQTAYGSLPEWHRFADWTGRVLNGCMTTKAELATRHSIVELVESFVIPEVPDVASLYPEAIEQALGRLDAIEAAARPDADGTPFRWRQFQRDDLSRFALHPGGIFALDKGGGKGLCLYAIPHLYGAKRTLIVAPEGLHDQICADWLAKFGEQPRRLMSVAEIAADAALSQALVDIRAKGESEVRGFWLTSYTALGYNGADEWPDEIDEATGEKLLSKKTIAARARTGTVGKFADGIGQKVNGILCVNLPSLATVLQDVFDCVECDEAVRLKATDSYVSLGVRRMRPKYPVALTGTPVKNRLEDLFWLAHWCAGSPAEGNARFPFANSAKGRELFANLYMVVEENHTRAEKYRAANPGRSKKFMRRLPQTTNVHELWRILGSLVMRRRKEDFGEDLVPKTIVPVKVKPGKAQQDVYRYHLLNPPTRNAEGGLILDPVAQLLTQLTHLRTAACCPDSPSLRTAESASARSWTDHTPLLNGTFRLIVEQLEKGEQVMVAAPFQHFSRTLEARLKEAGVSCVRLDGDTNAKQRGKLAADFKKRRFAVLIAGQQAMGEGHSFEQCATLILPALHWAFDVNSQVEDRVHRLTSKKPVTIYVLTPENTIGERLLALYREKSAASAAAIDGRLFGGPDEEEVSLGVLLREAQEQFTNNAATIDERTLEAEWPTLRDRLGLAEARFREWWPPIVPDLLGQKVTSAEVRRAVAMADLPSPAVATIRALPAATMAVLAGTADPARVERTRQQFAAFATAHPSGDWRQSWEQFKALPQAQREAYSPDHQDQTITTALSRLK